MAKLLLQNFSILTHYPTGLNGHPIVEELCQFLEDNQSKAPFYLAFLVDRMEEMMQSDASTSQTLLSKADQVCWKMIHIVRMFKLNILLFRYYSH